MAARSARRPFSGPRRIVATPSLPPVWNYQWPLASCIRVHDPDGMPALRVIPDFGASALTIAFGSSPEFGPGIREFPLMAPRKGRLVGQKRPLKPKEVWNIRARLQIDARRRDLAMFNLAIDSKLRGCDLVRLKIDDLCVGGRLRDRATIIQKKTGRPVQFEITEQTRASVEDWLAILKIRDGRFLFPSRVHEEPHISTRQYARIVHGWVRSAGLDDSAYGTHSMRRTKAQRRL